MKKRILSILLLSSMLIACGKKEISGTVYIVTKGHETIRMSLVPVAVYDLETLREILKKRASMGRDSLKIWEPKRASLEKRTSEAEAEKDAAYEAYSNAISDLYDGSWQRLSKIHSSKSDVYYQINSEYWDARLKVEYFKSTEFILAELPSPLQTTKTDANGQFKLLLKSKKSVLVANASRSVGSNSEHYYWIVLTEGKPEGPIDLNNDNVVYPGTEFSSWLDKL